MSSFAILTNTGRNKEAASLATGAALNIVSLAWGDGDRIPAGGETSLLNEQGRKPVQAQGVVSGANNAAFFDILLDETEGPFVIREAGLFDDDGDLIAIAKYDPVVNKPLNTVSALLRINIVFSDLENLVLQVSSTNAFVPAERQIIAGVGMTGGGDLSNDRTISADIASQSEALAGTSNAKLVTPLRLAQAIIAASADFTTAADVQTLIDALVGGAPGALDTLNELATALGNNDSELATLIIQIAALSAKITFASQAEAEAGINDTKLMTSLKVKQAFDQHVSNTTAFGAVGSYAVLHLVDVDLVPGGTVAGSALYYSTHTSEVQNLAHKLATNYTPITYMTGAWRYVGQARPYTPTNGGGPFLFVRIL